jgi:DNA-binding transcriptional ArsR family regulator
MAADPADAVFDALADPMRRRLLRRLSDEPATATELATQLPISRQAVTKHLGSLSQAGLLGRERSGRDVRYRVTPEPFSQAVAWMVEVGGRWDERLERLTSLIASSGPPGADPRPRSQPALRGGPGSDSPEAMGPVHDGPTKHGSPAQ